MNPAPPRPWYREPRPWILMAGPAAAVVAGAVTLWLALASADGIVADYRVAAPVGTPQAGGRP
jgi:hypothetical protein